MPMKVEGVDYTPEGIRELHEEVAELRNGTYKYWPESIPTTLVLTHTLALLHYLAELLEEQTSGSK